MTDAAAVLKLATPVRSAAGWTMVADRSLCLGPPGGKHMSGGSCLAALVHVLEEETGRPLVHANAQFIGAPRLAEMSSIEVSVLRGGRSVTLASAAISSKEALCVTATASLGTAAPAPEAQWRRAPDVPPPEACQPVPFVRADPGDLHTQLDMRLAVDERANPQGYMRFWVRSPEEQPVTAAFFCLIADYLPEAIHLNIGSPAGAVSLDNTIRIMPRRRSKWILCDTQLAALSAGFFHGTMSLFADDGTLLALASQSGVVRMMTAPP
jgi:acyl-CoA thioesterase II